MDRVPDKRVVHRARVVAALDSALAAHVRAERRHYEAAEAHDRVADFWAIGGDAGKAAHERDLARREREHAAIEHERYLSAQRQAP
jgi:hypothetical protein